MNILRSFTETVVTTPTDTFPISFEYDEKYDAVHVFLNGVAVEDLGYTVSQVNAVTLKVEPAIPEGTVRIERETDIDKMKYIFDAGALFIDQNVDADFKQIVHSQQEVRDGFIKLRGDVLPLVHGLQEALQQAQEASEAAQEAANAAEEAAQTTRMAENVIDFTGKNQQEVNDGLESIAELLSITTVRTGLRMYVKSYHAGMGKGGGWFVYDALQATVNNGINIFNGWVRISESTSLNAFDAGCVAVGDHTSYLDHEGMRRLAKYITDQYALGVTSFCIIFPNGNYIVQKQSSTLTSDFRQLAEDSFRLVNLPNLKLTLSYENATFTVRNGLRVGSFNRSDWSKYTGSSPFYGNASTFFMTPNHPFTVATVNTLVVLGNAEWNGNTPNLIVGGPYGDNGIQWSGNGCYFTGIDRLIIDANIFSHDHSGDGFYLGGANPVEFKEDLNDGRFMYIRGLEATRNGRNGISFVGGKNSSWYDCKSYKNGLPDHPTASNPRSNLDIEAETSAIRRARFYNFKSNQAGADGVVSAYQDSRDVIFYDSEFINKQRSIWIEKPQFKFYNCYFNGSIIGGYATTVEEDRTRYIDCIFEDNITKNPNMPTAPYLIQQNAKNPIFERCTFNSYLGKLFWVSSTPQGKYTTMKDCVINFYAHIPDALYGTYEFDGVAIHDKRPDPSLSMSLAITNALFKDVRILCDTQLSAITFSGTNNFDTYPQGLNQYVKTVAGNYQSSRFGSPVLLMPRYTTSFLYSEASLVKIGHLNAITDLKRNVLYNKGDTFHCTDPTAQGGISKWVCTTSGYYTTVAWSANTAYTVNTYLFVSNRVYRCTIAGTSGGSAPTHTSGTATNGTATFEYVGAVAVFSAYGKAATGLTATSSAADIVAALKAAGLAI
ncbi:tail fiber protein [Acinetobacter phage vB_AbaP_IME546]|uniref:Tail fiber protein n=1 Tax=Acinetobacter phage vB_AbaP_IME546 TaxID=2608405 RepID=A0A5P8PNZ5_9CAUD|nr:tail fiber protein [Acinetobacter phage vB_AbaP_IME546]QGJ97530.1 tail fiber protein [Acinetobacter phage vB_AbaP_IME546]